MDSFENAIVADFNEPKDNTDLDLDEIKGGKLDKNW